MATSLLRAPEGHRSVVASVGAEGGIEGGGGDRSFDRVGPESARQLHLISEGDFLGLGVGDGDGVEVVSKLDFSPTCAVAEIHGFGVVGGGAEDAPEWSFVSVGIAFPVSFPGPLGRMEWDFDRCDRLRKIGLVGGAGGENPCEAGKEDQGGASGGHDRAYYTTSRWGTCQDRGKSEGRGRLTEGQVFARAWG